MSRINPWIRYSTLPAVVLALACGGGGGGADAGGATEEGAEAANAVQVDPATAGRVVGTVSFEGEAPAGEPIDMSEEPTCAAKHETTPMKTPVVVGENGGLQNVYVHVTTGLPEGSWPTPSEAVEIDQDGCRYHPHIVALQTGQTLTIRNSDGLLHNINVKPSNQRGFNVSQPTDMTTDRSFSQPEVMIPVQCDVHGWMQAYIGVQDHPYFAVTGDDGSFTIENLPPGDYTIETWQEEYGTQTQQVTVPPSGEATADFTYSASMAATAAVPLADPIDLHDHAATPSAGAR
jgi:plastocyanin